MQRLRNAEFAESILPTTIFKQTPRGVSIRCIRLVVDVYFHPLQQINKGIIVRQLIPLLHQVNLFQIVIKVIQIHNLVSNHLCNSLVGRSIELLMDQKIIK